MSGIRTVQVCESSSSRFVIQVASKSSDETYMVSVELGDGGSVSCECKGFRFRGECSHVKRYTIECGWSELSSQPTQTFNQRSSNICPKCGNRTSNTIVGIGER